MMEKDRLSKNILSSVGVLYILFTIGTELWLCTLGLVIVIYSSQINQTKSPFLSLIIAILLTLIPARIGIGILRRQPWSRRLLLIFWLVASLSAFGFILFGLRGGIKNIHFWLEDVLPWFWILAIGILHFLFFNNNKIKKLFEEK